MLAALRGTASVKVVLVDIDGCILPGNAESIDISLLTWLRTLNRLSKNISAIPSVSVCSGRPQPFVECLLRTIDGYVPALFEWGGGLYIPDSYDFLYHELFTEQVRRNRRLIEDIIREGLVSKGKAKIQPGKEIAITIYPIREMAIEPLCEALKELLEDVEAATDYSIYCTQKHIDILPVGLNKAAGVRWLAKSLHLELEEIAGIGDDDSDLSFLQLVGFSACPSNATERIKAAADYVSPHEYGKGVLDILERLIG